MLAAVRAALRFAVPAAVGYLLGSFPTADLVSRSIDLRKVGDRNPGYWNARETLGRRAAAPVLVGDVAKGTLAATVGRATAKAGDWRPVAVGAASAMVGHAWPVFARFRGGRAVATFAGAAAVLSPRTTATAIAAAAATFGLRRRFADAVRVGFVTYPAAQLLIDGPRRTAVTGVMMSFIGLRFAMASGDPATRAEA